MTSKESLRRRIAKAQLCGVIAVSESVMQAAERLGVHPTSVYRAMKRFKVRIPDAWTRRRIALSTFAAQRKVPDTVLSDEASRAFLAALKVARER